MRASRLRRAGQRVNYSVVGGGIAVFAAQAFEKIFEVLQDDGGAGKLGWGLVRHWRVGLWFGRIRQPVDGFAQFRPLGQELVDALGDDSAFSFEVHQWKRNGADVTGHAQQRGRGAWVG